MPGFTYILASRRHGTLYIGVTNDLMRRVFEHRSGAVAGFTRTHKVHRRVWFEEYPWIADAIAREKQLKNWNRDWKLNLMERSNPEWVDLYESLAR